MSHRRDESASLMFGIAITWLASFFPAIWNPGYSAQPPHLTRDPASPTANLPPWRRALQADDAREVEALDRRAAELEEKGQFNQAIVPNREILAIRRRVQGEDHWQTIDSRIAAETCVRVGSLPREDQDLYATTLRNDEDEEKLLAQAQYSKVEPLLRKSLDVRRRLLGEGHFVTATAYHNLGSVLMNQGRYDEAEPQYRKALAIKQNTIGEDHPSTAAAYNELAINSSFQGRFADAEALARKALAVRLRGEGEDHPATAVSYNGLAAALNNEGKFVEAEPLLRKARDQTSIVGRRS